MGQTSILAHASESSDHSYLPHALEWNVGAQVCVTDKNSLLQDQLRSRERRLGTWGNL